MEFELIDRIRERAASRRDVRLGIGDDAALLAVPAGQLLTVSTDTLNVGVHFHAETDPTALGHKALAVNLSDLAAMGAEPAWCTLALSLPGADPAWLDRFLDGFLGLAAQHRVALVGGDTTRGPLSIGVTVHGFVPAGQALRRDAARVGDDLWLTGSTGDAAAALAGAGQGEIAAALRERLERPTPRVEAGLALRRRAHAAIDVSDGLLADLGHILHDSGVGAEIELDALPVSEALAALSDGTARWEWQLAGGDDYELLFTAAASARASIAAALAATATPAVRIGRIVAGSGCRVLGADGEWTPSRRGYQHFT